jgi:hypothetical protein
MAACTKNIFARNNRIFATGSTSLSVPHRKHVTSPLRAQQVNAVCRFVTVVYWYNCHNSGHYLSSCLLFERDISNSQVHVEVTQLGPIGLSPDTSYNTSRTYQRQDDGWCPELWNLFLQHISVCSIRRLIRWLQVSFSLYFSAISSIAQDETPIIM